MGAQSWTNTCGVCHVGGGQMEYDHDINDYSAASGPGDAFVLKYARLDDPATAGVNEDSWDNVEVGWLNATNKAEMDCLMCHLDTSNPGSAWLQTMDCGPTNQIGPKTDPTCSGTPMYPGTRTVTLGTGVTDYDMYNRNWGLKQRRNDLIASLGAGALGVQDANGVLTGVDWGEAGPIVLGADRVLPTPKSESCAICHARDDNTMGLPGMITMKTGFGNYGLIHDPSNLNQHGGNMGASSDLDTDNGANQPNDDYWFDFGCKTGMGKRAHKIGDTGDYIGPNARYGMSMFLTSTLDNDPNTLPNAGDPVPGKMPDVDVHDAAGMQCATCHYALGSETGTGYIDIPATTSHGFDYPAERIYAMDHQFAQADSLPDTKGKNNLDAILQCGVCHIDRSHPNLTDNGGTLAAPTPLHNGLPQLHIDRIGCVTCHVPETYSAPGRLKYRDWTAGFARGTFRNVLDWNFNLVEGNHNTVPSLRKWATKNGETKIYPFLPSLLPTWYELIPNSGVLASDGAGGDRNDANMPLDDNLLDTDTTIKYPSPVKNRDLQKVGEFVRDNNPQFDMRLNGGNTVPLFDGFQIVDSWEIDTEEEIDAMLAAFNSQANGSDARYVEFLNVIQADFDVTHGIVPKEWALGGTERGGCVSCHSSKKQVLSVDMTSPDFMQPNPKYSPHSVGFFEGYTQPIDNKGLPNFGVGGSDVVKNWMALFADFDAAEMCGMGNPALTANDGLGGMANPNTDHHNFYFNPFTGEPNMSALCDANMSWFSNNPMFGTAGGCVAVDTCGYQGMDGSQWTQTVLNDGTAVTCDPANNDPVTGMNLSCNQPGTLGHVINMMTTTFDAAMGFPSGAAEQMGMYDGVAGIQGFALKELQTQGTLGCNGFAGPASSQVAQLTGTNVNNCLPNYADAGVAGDANIQAMLTAMGQTPATMGGFINGFGCYDNGDHTTGTAGPGTCDGGFRDNAPCADAADCSGAMTDVAEIMHNPMGLIMGRAMAKSHFKIDLQQSYANINDPTTSKVKWTAGGEQNPSNINHVNKWDQAQYCYDYMNGVNPMMPNVVPCTDPAAVGMDGKRRIATAQSANQFLGYPDQVLELLMTPSIAVSEATYVVSADFSALASDTFDLEVSFDASRAACYHKEVDAQGIEVIVQDTCTYTWDVPGGTIIGGSGPDQIDVEYAAAGVHTATLTMTMVDDPNTPGDESTVSDSQSVDVEAIIVEDAVPAVDFATAVTGNTVTLTGTLDASVVRAYIYWGDRRRTVVSNMADFAAGIDHTYGRAGSYNIRVQTIDSSYTKLNWTFNEDGDLTVVIP